MCFHGLLAQYLTSSAAAIAVVYEERGEGEKETVVEKERKRGEGVTEKRNGSREGRKGLLPPEEIIVKGASQREEAS